MKFFLLIILMKVSIQFNSYCGYYGVMGSGIEQQLDDCFDKHVINNRVEMSIGFEKCFGFNYKSLNETVSKPIQEYQQEANKEIIDLSIETCVMPEAKKDDLVEEESDYQKKIKKVQKCKKYFDAAIKNLYDEETLDTTFLEETAELLEDLISEEDDIDAINEKIQSIIDPINLCKEPESALRDKLIEKYLKKYLDQMANPTMPAFKYDTLDVLLHPEIYTIKNDHFDIPKFDKVDLTQERMKNKEIKYVLLPKFRNVTMSRLPSDQEDAKEDLIDDVEDEQFWDSFKFWNSEEDDAEDEEELKQMLTTKLTNDTALNSTHTHHPEEFPISEDDQLYPTKVEIDDFWNKDIKLKQKIFNNEDFQRYHIKNWDIDKKLNKIFGEDDIKK